MMDFSVIVLIYNSDTEDLKLTIDSILQQKGITYQIVLADDASSNNALTEAEEYLREKGFKDYTVWHDNPEQASEDAECILKLASLSNETINQLVRQLS